MSELMSTDEDVRRICGQVKWFDSAKGFGFIVSDCGGPDILLHANVLRNFGQNSIAEGAGVAVTAIATQRGMQAVEVLDITPPEIDADESAHGPGVIDSKLLADFPCEPGRVKWFDKSKGFGFANVFGRPEDVFIHIEVLRRSGFADLQSGEAVGLRIAEGERGRMAVQVLAWETATRTESGE